MGLLGLATTTFNNLGKAFGATIANFGRILITAPFVYLGAQLYGANGVLLGQSIASAFVAVLAISYCFWLIKKLEQGKFQPTAKEVSSGIRRRFFSTPPWPFSSSRAVTTPVGEELNRILEPTPLETEKAQRQEEDDEAASENKTP